MKNNTPRRKRLNKNLRLARANDWIKSYTGKNIVKGYSKWFGVDMLCALRELKLSGVAFTPEIEHRIIKAFHQGPENKKRVKRPKAVKEFENFESGENFAVIIGYTSNGFPYGLALEELNAENENFALE